MKAIKLFFMMGICMQMAYSQEKQIAITNFDPVEVVETYTTPQPLNLFAIANQINEDYAVNDPGIEGIVRISLLVDREGNFITSRFMEEYPPELANAVMKHISGITFQPARQNGRAVADWVTIKFNFSLEE